MEEGGRVAGDEGSRGVGLPLVLHLGGACTTSGNTEVRVAISSYRARRQLWHKRNETESVCSPGVCSG